MKSFFKSITWIIAIFAMITPSAIAGTIGGTGSISGKVMSMGDPVNPPVGLKGYVISAMDQNWSVIKYTYSADDGSYNLTSLPANIDLVIRVYSEDPNAPFFEQFFDKKERFQDANRIRLAIGENRPITFYLVKAPNNSIQGMVMNAFEQGISTYYGKPLYVNIYSEARDFEKNVPVNQDGSYIIRYLKEATDYFVNVTTEERPYCDITYYYLSNVPKTSALYRAQATKLSINAFSQLQNINLYIDPSKARKIEGTVIAGQDMTGYSVYVQAEDIPYEAGAGVTPDGKYILCGVPPSQSLVVTAYPPEGSHEYYSNSVKISTANGDQTNVNITMQRAYPNQITGYVKDTSGKAIPNIDVIFVSYAIGEIFMTKTDSSGYYSMTGLKIASDYFIYVEYPLDGNIYHFYYYDQVRSVPTEVEASRINVGETSNYGNVNIIVGYQGGIIEGTVQLSNGIKLKDILVRAWSDGLNTGNSALTDANGYYKIWGLKTPETENQKYLVYTESNNHAIQYYNLVNSPEAATRVGVGVRDINFILQTGVSISGTVKNEAGQAITVGDVSASSKIAGVSIWNQIRPDGTYQLVNLPPAPDYVVAVFAKGYPPMWYKDQSEEPLANKIDLLKGDATVDFILKKGGIIKGTIFINDRFHRAPEGVYVHAWSPSRELGRDAYTNSNGDYEIVGLDSRVTDYILSAQYKGYIRVFYKDNMDADPLNDTVLREEEAGGIAPSNIIPRQLILPSGVSIKGTITYNGLPVSNIRVEAVAIQLDQFNHEYMYGRGEAFSTKELTNGFNYVISGLRPGPKKPMTNEILPVTYKVSIYPPIEYSQFAMQEREVQVSGTDVLNVNFELTKKIGKVISGTIKGLKLKEVVWVNAWSESVHSGRGISVEGTGAPGVQYEITSLIPAPDYVVDLSSNNYPRITYNNKTGWMKPDWVNISTDNASGIDFDLTLPIFTDLRSISGYITFPSTSIIGERVWVEAKSFSTGNSRGVDVKRVDENLTVPYTISGLIKASDYTVFIDSPKYVRIFYNGNTREMDADAVDVLNQSKTDINFTLTEGSSISGRITDSGNNGLAGIDVRAWSETSKTGSYTRSGINGEYRIFGLAPASDYIVEASDWRNKLGSFYYNEQGTVRDASMATQILIGEQSVSGINITITTGLSIKGVVKSTDGKSLKGIWVSAWSEAVRAGNGAFSGDDGTFEIKGLPSGFYDMIAETDWTSMYMSQKKTGIAAGSTNVVFTLGTKKGTCSLSGSVTIMENNQPKGVPGVFVELYPEFGNTDRAWAETNANGQYQISRLSAGNYTIIVNPPPASGYAFFSAPLTLSANQTYNIELKTGKMIEGKVTGKDGITPIINAVVQIYSKSTNFWQEILTDKNGNFRVLQVPNATDFLVTVMKDGYCPWEKTVSLWDVGSVNVLVRLMSGGSISGTVKNSIGKAIPNVQVEVYASGLKDQLSFVGTAWTDSTGAYSVKGLRKEDNLGKLITDYVVLINAFTLYDSDGAIRYARQEKTGVKVGDRVDFTLTQVPSGNEISGVIKNIQSIDGDYVAVDIFNSITGRFDQHVIPTASGNFKFVGLDPSTRYYLGFGVYVGKIKSPVRYQWAGDTMAVAAVENQPTQAATSYFPGTTNIQFEFDLTSIQIKKTIPQVPGIVKNLRIIGIPTVEIASDIQTRSTPQNIVRTPSATVTNSSTITVTWEPTEPGADEKYYCIFNREPPSSYSITKRNCPEPAITTRKSTSTELTGDYVDYYFHIAVEDDRGRIGETATLSFFIDTVAPKNPSVRALVTETTKESGTVTLELGATGATEMYISNTNFGEGGQWEKLSSSKLWTLTNPSDDSTIYVQFRDDARNIVNVQATISMDPVNRSLSNALKILQLLTGISVSAGNVTGESRITAEDVIFILQDIAGLRE